MASMNICVICMDDLNLSSRENIVFTECKHAFHTKCLMENVSHNGFDCPCCRTKMADEVESEVDEEELDEFNEVYPAEYEEESFTHRGMRWLFQAAQGEELDDSEDEEEDEAEIVTPVEKPSVNLIAQKLKTQNINMEDLVKVLLLEHEEYTDIEEECELKSDDIFGILRIIISNYKPEEEALVVIA